MKSAKVLILLSLAFGLAACSPYQAKPKMTYYHGQNVPEGYIEVVRASAAEIEFRVRVEFSERHLYHLLLDGNEPPASRLVGNQPSASGSFPSSRRW